MLVKLSKSSKNILGYKAVGTITREDYTTLTAEVEALLQKEESICLLLDLEEFEGENFKAWGADFKFGHEYCKKIARMVIVGDKKWQERMTSLIDPFYAREAEYFPTEQRAAAWEWLQA
ncbi:MAG: STAS/SEC14 domain-containing protein [Anaerolineales bacterium]|nr:STAS/SEC14 domain-containing protein [Anaerolineales bacterium]